MDDHDSGTGGTGGTGEPGRLLTHLEDKLAELDQLQHDLAQDAQALALALNSATEDRPGTRSIYSIREAAREAPGEEGSLLPSPAPFGPAL